MTIREHDTLDGLVNDFRAISQRANNDIRECVRDGIRAGNSLAQDYARATSGTHARKYAGTFTAEMHGGRGLFGNVTSGEYGPNRRGQGMLGPILERGSRNNPPHLNLMRSADRILPSFQAEAGRLADKWFGGGFGGSRGRLF